MANREEASYSPELGEDVSSHSCAGRHLLEVTK
jgi:hypothetical protein